MSSRLPVRLEDVARAAGVSTATVSHALSGKGRIPETTRARIREVAARMGYTPNAAARYLAGGRTGLIAVAFSLSDVLPVPLTDVDYFSKAIHAATARALERDYALVVAPPTPQTAVWSRIPLDGVVVFDPVAGDRILAELRARGVPLVLSGRDPAGGDDYCVDNDHIAGTRTVLDHLAERGARRVALLAGEPDDAFNADCLAAYRGWCAARGAEELAQTAPMGHMAEVEWPERLLARSEPPDAIYANDEVLGIATLRAAERRGLRVPGDLLLAVAADREPGEASVALTTLELDPTRTAAEAVDMLVDLIEGRPPPERMRLIPTRLVVRESTCGAGATTPP
ncbi:MAG TPA: LacI family DNA-binding transcriptional regulator [Gaiellales bacterium]|jgi:DNA-binding LacI/PurR family transcriptional regulator|nr:LacI family DNA-binding transcriptional regulator [Gaiellales bacterium]